MSGVKFEIEWRDERLGWHVLENRINAAKLWFPHDKLADAISFCEHMGAGEGGVIEITDSKGVKRERVFAKDYERGLVESPSREA